MYILHSIYALRSGLYSEVANHPNNSADANCLLDWLKFLQEAGMLEQSQSRHVPRQAGGFGIQDRCLQIFRRVAVS